MHYQIDKYLIKSENAALSTKQKNKIILSYIEQLPDNIVALDYGCGKCRYSKQLSSKTTKLVLIDSNIQISRTQRIYDRELSVLEYASRFLPNTLVYSVEEYDFNKEKFDFILCANVLSAIPFIDERKRVLSNIKQLLKPTGRALITVQYSNSYFNTYGVKEGNVKYEDGWIIKRGNSFSFYGIVFPDKLMTLCEEVGLRIEKIYKHDGSVYLTVKTSITP